MEESEEESRYERRKPRASAPARQELVMEPESYRDAEAEEEVDEPTRVSDKLPALAEEVDEPTKTQPPAAGGEETEQVRDYFEEFFSEK